MAASCTVDDERSGIKSLFSLFKIEELAGTDEMFHQACQHLLSDGLVFGSVEGGFYASHNPVSTEIKYNSDRCV